MDTISSSVDIPTLADGPKNYCIMNSSTPRNQEVKVEDEKPRIMQDYHNRRKTGNQDKRSTVPFYKLFSFADSTDVILMIVGAAGAMANGASLPLMTILFGNMIDSFGGNSDTHDVLHKVAKISLEYVYLAVVTGVASFLQVACWMATGERQASRIRNIYLKAILRQEISFFDKETNTGEVVERMSGDTVLIQDAMGEKVGKFIQLISTFLGSFVAAFSQGWLLTLVMLSTIPPTVIAGTAMSTLITKRASRGQVAYAEAAIIVEQTIGSIRTVASFTGEKQSVNKFGKSLRSAYNSSVQEGLAAGLGIGTVTLLMFCGYSLGVWYGSYLILHKHYTGANVINVIFAILVGSLSISQAPPCMTAFAAGQASAFKMFETINRKPEIDAYDMTGKVLDDIRGDVEFRDIYFSYPSRPEERIFSGFSMCIQSGMTMAMVGESGSGKSTVISLIERFYDPQAGEVLIDGINLKEFQLRWIRGKIGLVSQEPVLFASSIRDNITYGKDDVTTEEINAALQLSNASNFIYKMPQGIDTMVGEHGIQLSGGQKQRIAIARTILKVPRILLLDEATSALDAESEGILQDALDKVMENRTTIIVAHRLSTVRNADMITVLHQGLIVQKGSLPELMKDPNGAYRQLTRLQELNQYQPSSIILDVGSSAGNSSRHSFMNLPTEVDVEGNILEESGSRISSPNLNEVSLRRLAKLNKKEIPELILGVIATIVIGLLFPIFGLLLSSVITTFYKPAEKLQKESKFWSLTFLIFALVSLLATPARSYFFAVAGSKLVTRIRLMTFDKVVNMEIGWFDDPANSSGAIGARLSADAAAIRSVVGDALALVVQNIATLAAGLVIAFVANWQLSLIVLVLVPLLVLNGWIQMKFMKGFSGDAKIMYADASRVATDAVGSIRTIVSFSAEEKVMELYKKKCEDPMKAGIRKGLIGGTGFGLSFFLLFCCYAASFYAGARLIQDGKTSFVKVFQVFFSLALTAIGISQSSSLAPDYSKAKPAIASVFAILDQKSKINPSEDFGMTLEEVKGNIEFQHVSFRYPSRPDAQIFQDLCLFIKSGKTVALVGESGSGKSTAISLLQRFYNPDSGHILIDGIEIRKFQLRWLRQKMGLVSQEPVLFNDTIRANISYGKEEQATEAEIVSAAQSANAHKYICSLQQGYNTLVGERGIQLSGGQKQRVAIARAIVKEPRILLLDEATSALDAESERVVQDALDRVMMNRTTVVVAHRLGTIRGADLIAVIKNGMIVEKGKHEKLINIKDGVYASLVAIQSRYSS